MAVVVRGVPLALYPEGDYISDTIRRTGDFYEAAILDEIARRITGGLVIDVGAMIGNHAAYIAQFIPTTRIQAFEPVAANLELLRQNVAPYANVTVHAVALSDRSGTGLMTVDPTNAGHSMLGDTGEPVTVRTLDSYHFQNVRLLKVDVEGHEPQVLAGARRTIAQSRPLIVIEDWRREYAELLTGYHLAAQWEQAHQTFLYAP